MSTYPRIALLFVWAIGCIPPGAAASDESEGSDGQADGGTSGEASSAEASSASTDAPTGESPIETTTDDGTTDAPGLPPQAPVLSLGFSAVKQFEFTWTAVPASHYQLLERPLGDAGGEVALAVDLTVTSLSLSMPLHLRSAASYVVRACNDAGCSDSEPVHVSPAMTAAIGYVKASKPHDSDQFGTSAAISGDGDTLVVGAPLESGCAIDIDVEGSGAVCPEVGAVYVYARNGSTGSTWVRQAYLKPSYMDNSALFGEAVAISSDGDVLAIGARGEASAATGVDDKPGGQEAPGSGAVYIFVRTGGSWSQQAYLKASNTGAGDQFGASLALSASGETVAVGAPLEASAATEIDGAQDDDSAPAAGAVYVFSRANGVWAQRAYLKASNAEQQDYFGYSCALAGDGRTLVVGAVGEDSLGAWSGAAYVFGEAGGSWSEQANLKASNADGGDFFGHSVALAGDGATLAVAAIHEGSRATGIDGDENDDGAPGAGAVYLFSRTGQTWAQQAYVKAPNAEESDNFGTRVALSGDGSILGVGASFEDGAHVGVDGDFAGNGRSESGAAYVYQRDLGLWQYRSYVKAPNADAADRFGAALSLSSDGGTLVVGAPQEASLAQDVGGPQGDNSGANVGAVYVY